MRHNFSECDWFSVNPIQKYKIRILLHIQWSPVGVFEMNSVWGGVVVLPLVILIKAVCIPTTMIPVNTLFFDVSLFQMPGFLITCDIVVVLLTLLTFFIISLGFLLLSFENFYRCNWFSVDLHWSWC